MKPGTLVGLVLAHVAASAAHFGDNALRFHLYHDEATAVLNPATVAAAWVAQTAVGLAGLALARRGHPAGRPLLMVFGALGLAGLLHYLAPPSHPMGAAMHALIGLECATGLLLLGALALDRSRPPFATLK